MKILVLNGSPKGEYSITLQTVEFLQKQMKGHECEILHVGQRIKALEKDFSTAKTALEKAELIIFAYPVYTFMAPCQLHRFIELIKEHNVSLQGKYATQITTSKHFYDVTAHRYIQDNCGDLGMKFIKGLSADMDDLLESKGQHDAVKFWNYVMWAVSEDIYERIQTCEYIYNPQIAEIPQNAVNAEKGDIVIVTDCEENDTSLKAMIERFVKVMPRKTRIVNIREYQLMGGCLGCFNCAVSGKCIYKDGFDEFLRNNIQKGEALVYAFSIKDHSMGAKF